MFQSTHPYRVRPRRVRRIRQPVCFNPRTHTGCDYRTVGYNHAEPVSIHAPIQGATYSPDIFHPGMPCFNPRTHTGCDQPWGIRRRFLNRFNPRTHTGCDNTSKWWTTQSDVSIHAPIQGATQVKGIQPSYLQVSIHAPIQGATR